MIAITARLLSALLSLFPVCERAASICRIEQARDRIVTQASSAADETHVPEGVLLTVGFFETHLGTDANEGGGWGAPIDFRHRHTAGTPTSAARVLANGFRHCGTWRGAVGFFRSGVCRAPRNQGYVNAVMRRIAQSYDRAGIARPERFDR